MSSQYNISEVSTLTGIPKDLLRMWERRYGYPDPQRDSNGDRSYSQRQMEKLLLIRQLIDQGKRPGKLVAMDSEALAQLLALPKEALDSKAFISLLADGDLQSLTAWLQQQLTRYGLRDYIHQILATATKAVGNAWANGEIPIHKEHLYTEAVKTQLRKALGEQEMVGKSPRIMLTTVPGEQHSLGLMMVEGLLKLGGAEVIPFGTEMPFQEIKEAAGYHQVDVIALSFSASFKTDDAIVMLSGLRQLIDANIAIWAGGGAFEQPHTMPNGIQLLASLEAVEQQLIEWQDKLKNKG